MSRWLDGLTVTQAYLILLVAFSTEHWARFPRPRTKTALGIFALFPWVQCSESETKRSIRERCSPVKGFHHGRFQGRRWRQLPVSSFLIEKKRSSCYHFDRFSRLLYSRTSSVNSTFTSLILRKVSQVLASVFVPFPYCSRTIRFILGSK